MQNQFEVDRPCARQDSVNEYCWIQSIPPAGTRYVATELITERSVKKYHPRGGVRRKIVVAENPGGSGAEAEIRRAIELNPSYANAHLLHAEVLWQTGRLDEAIAETRLTLERDPLSLNTNDSLGVEFFLAREYDRAIEQEAKTLELDPNFIDAYYFRGMAYMKKSMYREGMAEFERGVAISPLNPEALTGLGYGYAVTGKRAEAQKVLDKLAELSKHEYISAVWRAKIYSGLGEKDMAFQWLEKAHEDRSVVSVGYTKPNPMFDPLRADPRYAELLSRTNLQP